MTCPALKETFQGQENRYGLACTFLLSVMGRKKVEVFKFNFRPYIYSKVTICD